MSQIKANCFWCFNFCGKHSTYFCIILLHNPWQPKKICFHSKTQSMLYNLEMKPDLISIVGSGYQSKWCSIQWAHQWEVQSNQFKKWSLTCWNMMEGDLRRATNTIYFTTSESYILPISHNTLKKWDLRYFQINQGKIK